MILSLYALFKIDDYHYSSNFATIFFEKLENSKIIYYLICLKANDNSENTDNRIELNNSIKKPSPVPQTQGCNISPSKRAKKIKIKIDKMITLKSDKTQKIEPDFAFRIRSNIDNDNYEYISEKKMKDFRFFANFFRSVNPDLKNLEIFDEIQFNDKSVLDTDNLNDFIFKTEIILQEIVDIPIYLNLYYYQISSFLNLHGRKRSRFLRLSPLIELRKFDVSKRRKTREGVLFENFDFPDQSPSLIEIFFLKVSPLEYKISSNNVEYQFQIVHQMGSTPKSWIISKSYSCFKKLNKDLEDQICSKIDLFDVLVPKAANFKTSIQKDFILKRKEGLFQYLDNIIKKTCYHGEILYNFLNFDHEKGNNKTPNISFPLKQNILINCNSAKLKQVEESVKFFYVFKEINKFSNKFSYFSGRLRKISCEESCNILF